MRKSLAFLCLLLVLSPLSWQAHSQDNFVQLHSGSMFGLLHTSYGWDFSDKHKWSLGLGLVPHMDNHDELYLFSARYRYQPQIAYEFSAYDKAMVFKPVSFGVSIITANEKELFTKLPDQYPSGYYAPTGTRILFNYQFNLVLDRQLELYWDLSAIDIGVANYVRNFKFYRDNYRYLGLDGILTYGFGARWRF